MSMPPTLKQMQYLVALSETGHFHQAAAQCHVSQSTLSAGLKEMENLLGQNVLNRQNRKKTGFTPFGLEVLETAKSVLNQVDKLTARAQTLNNPLSGPMRLGLIPTIAPYLLPHILPALQTEFPNMEFQIIEDLTANLIEKIDQNLVDIGIIAFPYETAGFETKVFYDEPFYCAAPRGVFSNKKHINISDLEDKNVLLLEDGHCLRDHALSACALQTKEDKKTLSATSLLTLIQMVAQGHGVTLLPEMVVKQGALPDNIALHRFTGKQPIRIIGAIWRAQNHNSANIQSVLESTIFKASECYEKKYLTY